MSLPTTQAGSNTNRLYQRAGLILDFFKGREDQVARANGSGFYPAKIEGPLQPEQMIAHLEGRECLGFYTLTTSSKVYCSCVDFDNKPEKPDPAYREKAEKLHSLLKKLKLKPVVEISQSGEAAHVWIFFEHNLPAKMARAFMKQILKKLKLPIVEIFPKQDELDLGSNNPLGNLIRYPLWNHSRIVDVEDGWRLLTPEEALRNKTDESDLKIAAHEIGLDLTRLEETSEPAHGQLDKLLNDKSGKLSKLWRGELLPTNDTSRSGKYQAIAYELRVQGFSDKNMSAALKRWACENEYEKGQKDSHVELAIKKAMGLKAEKDQEGEAAPATIETAEPFIDFSTAISVGNLPDCKPPEYAIDGLIYKNTFNMLGGDPKSGKTNLSLDIAMAYLSGGCVLGEYKVKETGPVLIINADEGKAYFTHRIKMFASGHGLVEFGNPLHYQCRTDLNLSDAETRSKLFDSIEEKGPGLIIIDPLRDFFIGCENDSNEMKPVLDFFIGLRDLLGAIVIVVDHLRKPGKDSRGDSPHSLRGSGNKFSRADSTFIVRAQHQEGHSRISGTHRYGENLKPIHFKFVDNLSTGQGHSLETCSVPNAGSRPGEKIEEYLKNNPGWHSTNAICKGVKSNCTTLSHPLEFLEGTGQIKKRKGKKNATEWCWADGEGGAGC